MSFTDALVPLFFRKTPCDFVPFSFERVVQVKNCNEKPHQADRPILFSANEAPVM